LYRADPAQCKHWKIEAVQAAIRQGYLTEQAPLAMFWNVAEFREEIEAAQKAFPKMVHTVAAKANPLLAIFDVAKKAGGGAECASLGELTQALKAGFHPSKIVFDSPTKTRAELQLALDNMVNINVDNFQELERLESLLTPHDKNDRAQGIESGALGIRVNTQVGQGSIKTHSTSLPWSKFGIGIDEYKDALLEAYASQPWLRMIHCHVGSQGCPMELIASGIRKMVDLVHEINKRRPNQIAVLDIGGGLPVNFGSEVSTPKFQEWADILQRKVPELFSGEFRVLTEHGRRYLAKAGFIVSRVEYTKQAGGRHIALQHAGVDLCIRTVYHPEQWPLRVTILDEQGVPRPNGYAPPGQQPEPVDIVQQDIAGPCCIAGDVIAHMRDLPRTAAGDWVVVHDTGAYYHSSWSYYNARQTPALYFYQPNAKTGAPEVTLIKPAATVEETLRHFT